MITSAKTSMDFINVDNSMKSSNSVSNASKATSTSYKVSDKNNSTKEEFKDVLNSKASEQKDSVTNDNLSTIKNLKDKIKELEEENDPGANDQIKDLLNSLLNLLNKLGLKDANLKDINLNSDSNLDLNNLMNKLIESLNSDSQKGNLDTDSLNVIQKLLNEMNENVSDGKIKLNNNIKDLISEVNKIIDSTQTKGDQVLKLEDILNKNFSEDNEGSFNNEANTNKDSSKLISKSNSETSKEDKFLNSLLDDKKDDSLSKMALLTPKVQNTQPGQAVNSVQPTAVNKETFASDLIQDVKYMTTNSIKELTVKVNPGNLGEITIKLIQEDGVMKANLKANSKETTALLSQNIVDIKKQLGEHSIKIADVNIELYKDDTTFFKQEGFDRQLSQEQGRNQDNGNNRSKNLESILEEDLSENLESIDNNNVNYLA